MTARAVAVPAGPTVGRGPDRRCPAQPYRERCPSALCLLTVHAHPDDEASKGAGTVARYHAEGVRTVLVCCTGGEEGDILNPAMDTPEVQRRPAPRSAGGSWTAAAAIIGYDEVVMLGYRDSGMPGSEANARPDGLRPGPAGRGGRPPGGGHPAGPAPGHRHLSRGPERVPPPRPPAGPRDHHGRLRRRRGPRPLPRGRRGLQPAQALLHRSGPASAMLAMHEKFLELGLESPFDEGWLARARQRDEPTPPRSTSPATPTSGVTPCGPTPPRSTRPRPSGSACRPRCQRTVHPVDEYFLARSRVGGLEVLEDDLFAGID